MKLMMNYLSVFDHSGGLVYIGLNVMSKMVSKCQWQLVVNRCYIMNVELVPWCNCYHYSTTSFNKGQSQVLYSFCLCHAVSWRLALISMKKAPVNTFIGQPFHQNNSSHQSISRSVFLNKLELCLFSPQERSDITKKNFNTKSYRSDRMYYPLVLLICPLANHKPSFQLFRGSNPYPVGIYLLKVNTGSTRTM